MRNCLFILLFLVLSLTIPATSVYAHEGGDGGSDGRDETRDASDPMVLTGSSSSDTTKPPSGFTPVTQEGAGSEITTSSETDPGKEEEVAELVEEVNTLEETAQEGEVEDDSSDSDEGTTSDSEEETAEEGDVEDDSSDSGEETTSDSEEETAEEGDVEEDSNDSGEGTTSDNAEETAEEGNVEDDSKDSDEGTTSDEKTPDGNTPTEDQGDKKTEVATSVDDIDPHGSTDESKTTGQPDPGQSLIGSQGTLPGTKSATLDQITEPEINEDGSISTWAIYSNDTWVLTTVNTDGTNEVSVLLDSGTVIRPGREYIHSGGSLSPALDAIITALEVTAAAGTVAGWALTVTPAGALASGGVKTATAVWGATTGIQALRAGADAYGQNIDEGASQGEAIYEGTKQTAVNAVVVSKIGKYLGDPYEEAIGSFVGETGKVVTEVAVKNYGNYAAHRTTENITGYGPGYKPY